eukprot:m.344850 g.344850  ORF g.344850 m.344850 type:complete len:256 (-) comp16137_c1_seq1:12272-13039(-)
MARQVLVKGASALVAASRAVPKTTLGTPQFQKKLDELCSTLDAFRADHGFGRGIAAPQIGYNDQFIALNLASCDNHELYKQLPGVPSVETSFPLINPVITWHGSATMTLWDDCMSLPDTLVLVQRWQHIRVEWIDRNGTSHTWDKELIKTDLSELLQHEIDHLHGTLADRQALAQKQLGAQLRLRGVDLNLIPPSSECGHRLRDALLTAARSRSSHGKENSNDIDNDDAPVIVSAAKFPLDRAFFNSIVDLARNI